MEVPQKTKIELPYGDLPGGPVVKNLPYNAGDVGLIPGQGTKIPHAAGQLSPRATTTELTRCKLQSPRALEPMRHNYRAHAPWSLCATTRENLHATTREKPTHHNEEPMRRNERSRMPQQRSCVLQRRPNEDKTK